MERGEGRGYGDEKDPNENANAINENEKDRRRRHHKEHDDQDQDLLVRQSTNNTNTASSSSSRRSSPASTRLLAPSLAPMAPTAEIAWYFPTSRIQFRLLAKVYVLASPSFSMEDKEEGNEQHHHHHRSLGGLFPVDLAGEPPTENMRVGETQKEKESENEEDENEEDEKGKGKEPDDGDGDGAKNKHGGANVGESDRAKANRKGGDAMNRRRTMERRKRTRRMKEWEMVRVRAFDTLSPALRASFARPYIPGSVLSNPEEAKEWPTELGPISDQPQEQEQENHDHDHDQDQEKERMEKIDGREEREEEEEAMRGIGEKVGREGVPSASVRPTVSASASASASASPGEAEKMKKRALENFAVVYLDVEEVDVVDLGKIPNERYRYRKVVEAEERVVGWKKDVLVP
ncbi:hypothetical protein FRC14_001545 [Serendipita sp. 396]|nr:hypothetical protein FRC14_001545 [Serendipita sp. 396]